MGRPKLPRVLERKVSMSIWLTDTDMANMRRIANAHGISRCAAVRLALITLREKLDREESTPLLPEDIASAINRHSAENGSDTPDFILAEFLMRCLDAFDGALSERETWYGRPLRRDRPATSGTGDAPVVKP